MKSILFVILLLAEFSYGYVYTETDQVAHHSLFLDKQEAGFCFWEFDSSSGFRVQKNRRALSRYSLMEQSYFFARNHPSQKILGPFFGGTTLPDFWLTPWNFLKNTSSHWFFIGQLGKIASKDGNLIPDEEYQKILYVIRQAEAVSKKPFCKQ